MNFFLKRVQNLVKKGLDFKNPQFSLATPPENQNDDGIAYQFLDYNKSETIKENVLMVDEIFQNLKEIRSLHSQKKTLNRARRVIFNRYLQKHHANRQTR